MTDASSFKSYVEQAESNFQREKKVNQAFEKVSKRPEHLIKEKLLPGEQDIGHANKVIKYNAHGDPSKGTAGTLICTNFRICFITSDRPTFNVTELSNKLFGEEDITLNNIDCIFVEYPNKRKKLLPKSKVKDGIQRLELHCKDFRVVAFNFKLTLKGEEKSVVQSILHHAYPTIVSHLFALDHKHGKNSNEASQISLYRSIKDWSRRLTDGLGEIWRVSSVNRDFMLSDNLGAYFVVPSSVNDNDLKEAANQFVGNKIPTWCWTAENGCSLVRSAELRPETGLGEWEKRLHDAIQGTNTMKKPLRIIDVGKCCPNCFQIQQSFNKLKNLCMPASENEFWESDGHWLSMLHSSKWYHHVATVLSVVQDATQWLTSKNHHVIVREETGVDVTPAVTSLIQLVLDRRCRTLDGFQDLIQREWVVGCHPFCDRLGHLVQPVKNSAANSVLNSDNEANLVSPVFLLFLDCVWQLLSQHPTSFEFSSTFLTVLYDGTKNSAFDTFFFNNERQRRRTVGNSDQYQADRTIDTLPLWAWSLQYDENDMKLFKNPLYWDKLEEIYKVCPIDEDNNDEQSAGLGTFSFSYRLHLSSDSLDVIDENSDKLTASNDALASATDQAESMVDLLDKPRSPSACTSTDAPARGGHRRSASDTAYVVEGDNSDDMHIQYNKKTGVVVVRVDNAENEKKKRKFSIRRKRPAAKASGGTDEDSTIEFVPSEILATTSVQLAKRRSHIPVPAAHLMPRCDHANMKFWYACYLRWNSWSRSLGGGPAALYRQQSILVDEVHGLLSKIRSYEAHQASIDTNGEVDVPLDDSGMYFHHSPSHERKAHDKEKQRVAYQLISNFFPYSPVRCLSRTSTVVAGTPAANFTRSVSIFNFGMRSRTPKLNRAPSDLSITTPSGNGANNTASAGGAVTSLSSNNVEATEDNSPKKEAAHSFGSHPRKALMPPKDKITYISSV